MHYDQYLARGLPIASGSVEGACKNLIKDRMERSGMRWTEAMAEAIVKLRAIYLSGDFDQYWPFHIQKDQERLHPAGRDRKSTRLNSSHGYISYAVFCLKKTNKLYEMIRSTSYALQS